MIVNRGIALPAIPWLAVSCLAGFCLFADNAAARIHTETVEYKQGDTTLEGYLAYDDSLAGPRPGVLVIHEWTGLGAYVKGRAEQLARQGFVAFAADIYGKGVRPSTSQEAAKTAAVYYADRGLMRDRARAGLDALIANKRVDRKRVAVIGYCFGGGGALELARSDAPVAGVVSFHGSLDNPNPEGSKAIKAKLLVCTGADDPFVTQEKVDAFWKEMREAGTNWQLNVYSGAVHSFTNPSAGNDPSQGAAYNPDADRRSWQAMMDFFSEIFQ
jgi:dienelactone hydrolase